MSSERAKDEPTETPNPDSTAPEDKTEKVIPGDKLTVSLAKKPDRQHPDQPYLATYSPHRRQRYERRYSTREEAEEAIETAQTRAHRNFKDSDRSMWD